MALTLFLCGDVMPARGIDQILPVSNNPVLHEEHARDARGYVGLAEKKNGPIPRKAPVAYPWGEALAILDEIRPDLRIINLETSVTTSDDFWPGKGIHYRMHPGNAGFLAAARVDCCVLANNHVLDLGRSGLVETLRVLRESKVPVAGAGESASAAAAPAQLAASSGARVLVFGYASETSGVPVSWAAGESSPGVNFLPDLSPRTAEAVIDHIRRNSRPGDLVLFSVHWGSNWGFEIPAEQMRFARALIDSGAVDLVHGHSSHHPRALEVYRGKLILYGAGDFLNDYEGITRYGNEFRADLVLMYFPTVDPSSGVLSALRLVPLQIHRFSLRTPAPEDVALLSEVLNREGAAFGTRTRVSGNAIDVEIPGQR